MFRTLLLGPSNLDFTETDAEATMPNLIRSYLQQQRPDFEHELTTAALQFGDRMAAVAVRAIEREDPNAVLIQLGTYSFDEDRVVFALQRRWPKLFRTAMMVADTARRLSGGGPDGGGGLRGQVYKVPRALALRAIGAEPRIPMSGVLRWTRETVNAVAKFEDKAFELQVLTNLRSPPIPVVKERVEAFLKELRSYCAPRQIPVICREEYCAAMGIRPQPARGAVHGGRATREADARAASEFILKAAGVEPKAL